MKFVIKMSRYQDAPACPGLTCTIEEFTRIDRRRWKTLEECKATQPGQQFLARGTNHRQTADGVECEIGKGYCWVCEIDDLAIMAKLLASGMTARASSYGEEACAPLTMELPE